MAYFLPHKILADFASFKTTGEFSDFSIVCDNDVYPVHKIILSARSPVFHRAMAFGGKESAENKIDLSDDDPQCVKLLIQYLYEADYEPLLPAQAARLTGELEIQMTPHACKMGKKGNVPHLVCSHHTCGSSCTYTCISFVCSVCLEMNGDAGQLLLHSKMYQIADLHDVSGLKELCKEKFRRACNLFWTRPQFCEAIQHVFESTPDGDDGLRSIVCSTISRNMSTLQNPEVDALMRKHNGLAYGVLLLERIRH